MRVVEKRGYDGVTTCAVPSKTARGQRRKQAGRHEDTCHGWDSEGMCCGLHHPGRKMAETGSSGEGGTFAKKRWVGRGGGKSRRCHRGGSKPRVEA